MTEAIDFATIRFSTDDLPEKDRVAIWREHFGYNVLGMEIEPAEGTVFRSSVVSRRMPGLNLVSGNLSAARLTRTRAFAADGNDDLALIVNCTGAVAVTAAGREVVLRERDAVLVRSDEVGKTDRFGPSLALLLMIPRAVLAPLVVDLDDAVMRHITRRTEALKLLTSYASTLPDDSALSAPLLANLVVSHMHDLVALALGATHDAACAARDRGARAARLTAVKTWIMQHSARRDLSVRTVAARFGVSPRYVQTLFELDGTTFTAFLMNQRLTRAHRMLCTPRSNRRGVSTIAYDVGFGDLSYFHRCFRKFYGVTPQDVREATANVPSDAPGDDAVSV